MISSFASQRSPSVEASGGDASEVLPRTGLVPTENLVTKNDLIKVLFSLLLIPLGAVLVLLVEPSPSSDTLSTQDALLSKLGLALMVAGLVSSFHEGILKSKRFGRAEAEESIAETVIEKLRLNPPSAVGIRLVSPVRKGYHGYYRWAVDNGPQCMFFAGRAVLQRVDADFKARNFGPVEEVIARRLKEGCELRILFLDPRCSLIDRLAKEENQRREQLLLDLASSISVTYRIAKAIKRTAPHPRATLAIQVFDEVPYFAYHQVDEKVIVGFYFASVVGHQSAAFEVVDSQTERFFESHFSAILARSRSEFLLRLDADRQDVRYNYELMAELRAFLITAMGEKTIDSLIPEEVGRNT